MAAGARDERRRERRGGVEQLAQQVALQLPLDLLLRALLDELEREHGGGVLERLLLQRRQRLQADVQPAEVLDRDADRPGVAVAARRRPEARAKRRRDVLLEHDARRRAAARARRRCARGRRRSARRRSASRCTANEPSSTRFCSASASYSRPFSIATAPWAASARRQRDLDRRELQRAPAADVQRADDLLAREHRAAQHRADPLAEDRVADPGRRRRARARVVGHRDRRPRRDDEPPTPSPSASRMRMNGSVRAPTATRMSSVPVSSLTSPIHARSVPSSSRARRTISCSACADVGLRGLDLHPDLDQRLVGRRAPRLHLDLLDQQRQVGGEHRHQRPRVARPHAAAAQVGDERAADGAGRVEHRLDAVHRARRASPRRARPPATRGASSRPARSLMPCVAITATSARRSPGDRAVLRLQHRPRGLERRPRERDLLFGPLHQLHALNSYSCTSHSASRCLRHHDEARREERR